MITLLVEPAVFALPEVKVEGDSYRHLFRARRVEVGETLRVVDGRGRARWGAVARVAGTSAAATLWDAHPSHEPGFERASESSRPSLRAPRGVQQWAAGAVEFRLAPP